MAVVAVEHPSYAFLTGNVIFPPSISTPTTLFLSVSTSSNPHFPLHNQIIDRNETFLLQLPRYNKNQMLLINATNACNKLSFVVMIKEIEDLQMKTIYLGNIAVKTATCPHPYIRQLEKFAANTKKIGNRLATMEGRFLILAYFILFLIFAWLQTCYPRHVIRKKEPKVLHH